MIIPEIVVTSIALLVFGLLLVLAALRLRSQELVVFHLTLYVLLGLILSLALLMTLLPLANLPVDTSTYSLVSQFALLAMILSFGGLTLSFLRKNKNFLIGYWVGSLLILTLWTILTFNLWGWNEIVLNFGLSQIGSPPLLLSGIGWIAVLATILLTVISDFRKRQSSQYKNRLQYWLIATTLLLAGGLILFISPGIFNWAGLPLLLAGSILASYTILSYQTPDLKLLFGRAIRYSGVTATLSGIFLLSLAIIIVIARTFDPTHVLFWSIILAIILANIFPPVWRLSTRLLTRIVFGKQHPDEKQLIKTYSQKISTSLDLKRLGDTIINLMIETLGIAQGIVFMNERSGMGDVALRPIASVGMEELTTGYFSLDSPFVKYFRRGKKSLNQYDIEVLPEFRSMPKKEQEWLSNLGMELYIPVVLGQGELVGLLAFGPQPQGAYYEEDLDLMTTMADQTALAMDSARLFEQLAIINQEVGSLTEEIAGIDASKTDFLSIASHELRTPLTHIHGYSRMLLELTEEELKDPTYIKTLIEGVAKGSERMKDVVDVMFDVTEANVGEMRLFKGQVNLEEVIEQASRLYITALDERRIAFGKTGIKELPIIEADGTRLVQAFENLIGNAVKYTPDGGTITVEGHLVTMNGAENGEEEKEPEPAVEIIVADTGIGIDPEYHDRIFEKFFRIDDTLHHSTGKTKFKGAGPGLGLTLVKGIAEAHGGRVWVESLGQDEVNCPGSKFHIVIPTISTSVEEKTPVRQAEIETRHWRRGDFAEEEWEEENI